MFNILFVFSLFIWVVAAQLKDGIYRIVSADRKYVAEAGPELGDPVVLDVSQSNNMNQMVSFFLCRVSTWCSYMMHIYSG